MTRRETLDSFYRDRVPAQFNRTLARQREHATMNAAAARMLEEMEAVRASIAVEVAGGPQTFFDIERGQMRVADEPTHAPFLILGHTTEDFEHIRRECGDSLLGFLGALAGLGDEMRLTSQRVRSLRDLKGSLIFERVGPGGFTLLASFGIDRPERKPRTRVRLDEAVYAALRKGEVDPQDAFLDGRIEVEGDLEMAIGLALAAVSAD